MVVISSDFPTRRLVGLSAFRPQDSMTSLFLNHRIALAYYVAGFPILVIGEKSAILVISEKAIDLNKFVRPWLFA